jgi:serine protease inhibitor
MGPARLVAMLVVIAVVGTGCGMGATGPAPGDAGAIDVDHEPDGQAAADLATAVNTCGFELLRELADGDNVVISPVSVSTLLAMVLAGAGGETAEAIATALHLDPNSPDVQRYGDLLLVLTDTDDARLAIANSLWAMNGVPFEEDYLGFVRPTFGATLEEVDLGSQAAADQIDAWVADRTEGLIEEFADALGLPNPQAVLVLLNAVYFKGAWTDPFDPNHTHDGPFMRPDGSTVAVPLMTKDETVEIGRGDGFTIARLPYGDGRFGMEILLPDDDLGSLVARLTVADWNEAVGALAEQRMFLTLPRFDLSYDATLNDVLTALGMGIAFTAEADFTPMSPAAPWLDVVAHETRIIVDEEGTEAAAVTGGVMVTSMPPEFRVDRPFLFTISDRETGAVLFLGAITDPTG